MAWTAPTTRATGELITASVWNEDIVDNLNYLKDGTYDVKTVDESANYTTSSGTFANIDSDDLSITVNCEGTCNLLVYFQGVVAWNGGGTDQSFIAFDVTLDGTRQAGDDGIVGIGFTDAVRNGKIPVSFIWVIKGVSEGAHTVRVQWKNNEISGNTTATLYAGAGTSNFDVHPQFGVLKA